jgi:hypothetical protein
MLRIQPGRDEHEKYKKLCALAASGNLAPLELAELQVHLGTCEQCSETFAQHQILASQGVAFLMDRCAGPADRSEWDSGLTRERLMERVRADQVSRTHPDHRASEIASSTGSISWVVRSSAAIALAASLLLMVGWGAYHLGARTALQTTTQQTAQLVVTSNASALGSGLQALSSEKNAADQLLAEQAKKLNQLQVENSQKAQEAAKLRSDLAALEERSDALAASNNQSQLQLRTLGEQRDELTLKLQAANQAYADEQSEFASLRLERDKTAVRTSSLEAQIAALAAANRDQERQLKDTDQYLTSDRDIRELMGARKLYIADVFDVDGSSRTQKPFGRVFYTQGKSLIFYAFDLDHEPGVVNASTFQVWGQREKPQGEQSLPMNLGILYMDNETNRRWVMRFDDPKKLSEIDAVFVTVEPRGGSHKPTSKPFLYALLRNEANHP